MYFVEKEEEIAGKKVFYIKQPVGEKDIIFMHGKSYTASDFLKLNDTLIGLYNLKYRIYAFDFPGFGKSQPNNIEPVNFIEAFVDYKKLDNFVLFGASMSGGFALKYALLHPEKVRAIIAAAPAWIQNEIEQFKNLNVPTLLLWGANDNKVDPKIGNKLKEIMPNARLHTFRGLSHPFYFENENLFDQYFFDFLKNLDEK
ncbi:MAG: alpha/beta fold hydrolase [Desulfurella sp.]|uniref:alpha/beta fold hydrolase n=1 Tax=Desulfurella sp. TaxID=1962857 RepID=UPI003D0C55B0